MSETSRLGSVSHRRQNRRDQGIDQRLREKVREAKARGSSYEKRRSPPVMVRGGIAGPPLPLRKTTNSRAKRRYDLTLSVPGAEMRLPALPQISIDLRLLSGVMVAVLGLLIYYLWNSPSFHVEGAKIIGLQRLNSRDINAIMNLEGESIFAIDPQVLEQKAREAFPEFALVKVDVGMPANVDITVEERLPILTWRQEGRTVLVDANGIAFPQRDQGDSTPAMVVEAFDSPPIMQNESALAGSPVQFIPVEMVSAILSMSAQAPDETPVVYDSKHGLGWKDTRGWEVYFGDALDIDMKLRVYNAMLKELQDDGVQPVLISVEYIHRPYYRLER